MSRLSDCYSKVLDTPAGHSGFCAVCCGFDQKQCNDRWLSDVDAITIIVDDSVGCSTTTTTANVQPIET